MDFMSEKSSDSQNKKQQILIVSHCFFNDAVKLKNQNADDMKKERRLKRAFITQMLSQDIEFIQLPCPEFILYGSRRWGHAASQFNTPHFRREARLMLEPIVMQLEEYNQFPKQYEILGILGIDGSPSCGVNYTYDGDWGGELGDGEHLPQVLQTLEKISGPGVLMEVLKEMLDEKHLPVRLYSLDTFATITAPSGRKDVSDLDLPLSSGKKDKKSLASPDDSNGIKLL